MSVTAFHRDGRTLRIPGPHTGEASDNTMYRRKSVTVVMRGRQDGPDDRRGRTRREICEAASSFAEGAHPKLCAELLSRIRPRHGPCTGCRAKKKLDRSKAPWFPTFLRISHKKGRHSRRRPKIEGSWWSRLKLPNGAMLRRSIRQLASESGVPSRVIYAVPCLPPTRLFLSP